MLAAFYAYPEVAARMGLRMSPRDPSLISGAIALDGVVDGQAMHFVRIIGSGHFTRTVSVFPQPLDLGLVVNRGSLVEHLAALLGSEPAKLGDDGFDPYFQIRADEPSRARALLTPPLRAALLALTDKGFPLHIDDARIHVVRPWEQNDDTPEQIEHDLRTVAALARWLGEAREAVAVAADLAAHEPAWRTFAGETGLALSTCPLGVSGHLGQARVAAHARRIRKGEHALEVTLWLDRPLALGLSVSPAGPLDRLGDLLGLGDIPTGDEAFDRAFVLRATRPDAAAALLDDAVRDDLISLRNQFGHVALWDSGLTVHAGHVGAPQAMLAAVERLEDVATRLLARADSV